MYVYFIRDDDTGMYLIGRMMLGAPVPTCVWGERRADALVYGSAAEARGVALTMSGSVSIYRVKEDGSGPAKRIKFGGDRL